MPHCRADRRMYPRPGSLVERAVVALANVIAYDTSDDRCRARIAAILQTYWDRVQRSVFVASGTRARPSDHAARSVCPA
jgi:hypothetical protein